MLPVIRVMGLELGSYPVMCASGAAAALLVSLRLSRIFRINRLKLITLYISGLTSGIIGAAALYAVVTYPLSEIPSLIRSGSFKTGLVFYGGLTAGAGFTYLIARLLKLDTEEYARAIVPALPLGHAFGRIGCFLSGCCYGVYIDAIGFSLPVQLIEAVCLAVMSAVLVRLSRRNANDIFCRYLLMYAPARFLLEFLRGDSARGFISVLSVSQWISLALIICAAVYIKRKHQ